MEEDILLDEQRIASERAEDRRKVLEELMIYEPIRKVPPRIPAICVPLNETVSHAIRLMNENRVGSVLVTRDEILAGIVTERDILMKAIGPKKNLDQITVESIMTPNPEVLKLDDPIVYAYNKMGVGNFRHIPIVDELRRPVALLSVRHIIHHIVEFFGKEVFTIPPEPGKNIAGSREGA